MAGANWEGDKGDWEGAQWTITGNPKQSMTIKEFESAYDFEDFLKEHINCNGIEFDFQSAWGGVTAESLAVRKDYCIQYFTARS